MTDCIVQNSGLVFANIHYIHSPCKKEGLFLQDLGWVSKKPKKFLLYQAQGTPKIGYIRVIR